MSGDIKPLPNIKMTPRMKQWLFIMILFVASIVTIFHFVSDDEPGCLIETPVFSTVNPFTYKFEPYRPKILPKSDFETLINIRNFSFILNNFPCDNSRPLLLILVSTAPKNYALRMTIRNTWGKTSDNVKLVFLLGSGPLNLIKNITNENEKYKDLIVGNFWDSYRNMTYKQTMGLKWAAYFCPNAKYVLKTDDDVFVNIHYLEDFLVTQLSPWGVKNLIMCDIFFKNKVFRSHRSKWKVTFNEFKDAYYPPYCAGYAILYSPDILLKIYKEAQMSEYFWIDDVFLTGILREKLQLQLTQAAPMTLSPFQISLLLSPFKIFTDLGKYLYGAPDISSYLIQSFWNLVDV